MSPDTLGTAVVTHISVEYCDFFFFSFPVFSWFGPLDGGTDLIQCFQRGQTDILPKLNFKIAASPRSGSWAVCKSGFVITVVLGESWGASTESLHVFLPMERMLSKGLAT